MKESTVRRIAFLPVFMRLITFIVYPKPVSYPDSPGYANGRFFDFDLVSFTGQSSRGWPTPLLYSLLPNPALIGAVQLLISGAAWYLLIVNAVSLVEKKWSRIGLSTILVSISSASVVIQWDTVVLGTSLLNSTAILITAFLIRVSRENRNKADFYILGILLTIFALEKLSNLPLIIGCLVIYVALIRLIAYKHQIFAVIITSLLILSYTTSVGLNVDRNWKGSYSGTTLLWQLGNQSPTATKFKHYLQTKSEAPKCIYMDAPYADLDSSVGNILKNCHEGLTYIRHDLQSDFIKFALFQPIEIVKLSALGFGAYFTNSSNNYGNAVQILPTFVNSIFIGGSQPSLTNGSIQNQSEGYAAINSGMPYWLFAPGFGLLLAGFLLSILSLRRSDHSYVDTVMLVFSGLLFAQSCFTTIFLPSEWVRQLGPYLIPLATLNVITIFRYFDRDFIEGNRNT